MIKRLLAGFLLVALLTGTAAAAGPDVTITLQMLKTAAAASTGQSVLILEPAFAANSDAVSVRLPLLEIAVLMADADGGFESLVVKTPLADITFSADAVRAYALSLGETALLSVQRLSATEKAGAVHASLQSRPAYRFSLVGGQGKAATAPASGAVVVSIPYGIPEHEQARNLSVVRVGDGGGTYTLPLSAWADGKMVFRLDKFATYVIDHRAVVFPDALAHWGRDDVEFAAARGILVGMSADSFQPNGNVLWAQAVTALSRMAGLSFPAADNQPWYAPQVAWATANGMMPAGQDPTATINRQEMAGLLDGFLQAVGDGGRADWTPVMAYTDRNTIAPEYWRAVAFAGAKGILKGRENGTFDPHGHLTRAELAAILGRMVRLELEI